MDELVKFQDSLNELLSGELDKIDQMNVQMPLEQLCRKTKEYSERLVNVRLEMQQLLNRSTTLRKRALKLQQEKQEQALKAENALEEQLRRDKHLEPVVVAKMVKK